MLLKTEMRKDRPRQRLVALLEDVVVDERLDEVGVVDVVDNDHDNDHDHDDPDLDDADDWKYCYCLEYCYLRCNLLRNRCCFPFATQVEIPTKLLPRIRPGRFRQTMAPCRLDRECAGVQIVVAVVLVVVLVVLVAAVVGVGNADYY